MKKVLSILLIFAALMLPMLALADSGAKPAIDLTPIFQAVIALAAALVTYKLIPWLRTKTTAQQQANLTAAARMAVFAAEQLYGAGHGGDKLDYALSIMQKAGYHLDGDALRGAIESAVHTLNNPFGALIEENPLTEDQKNE